MQISSRSSYLWLFIVAALLITGCKSKVGTVSHADNRAMVFDGIDDYVDLGNIYDDLSLPVTISAWIWLDPNADDGLIPIFDSQDGLDVYNGFNFLTSRSSSIAAQYGDGIGSNHYMYRRAKSAIIPSIQGRWTNLTAVVTGYDEDEITLFVDGVDVKGEYSGGSHNPMKSNSPEEVAKIGYLFQNGTVFRFRGKMDELKVWNRALNRGEVQKAMFEKPKTTESGLIGYWNFDETTGTSVLDHSGNHFNGVIKGDAQRSISDIPVRE